MKILLFSGPPRSGKDTAAKYVYNKILFFKVFERFSAPLKTSFAAITNTRYNEFYELDYYEDHKEEIIPWLGVSYRQYQINLSEQHFKPLYGQDIFGKLFLARLKNYRPDDLILVPDCGFKIEVECLEKAVPLKDVLLVRIHRQGCDFSKDSRSYIYPENIMDVDVYNNGTQAEFEQRIDELYKSFMNDFKPVAEIS